MRWRHVLLLTIALHVMAQTALAECTLRDVLCSEETAIDPVRAAAFLRQELGVPLPKGLTILNFTEGGFQDLFIEVEFVGPPDDIATMLRLLAIDPADLTKTTSQAFGILQPPRWSLTDGTPIMTAEGVLGSFSGTTVAVPLRADADGRQRIFLFAFKT